MEEKKIIDNGFVPPKLPQRPNPDRGYTPPPPPQKPQPPKEKK